MQESAKAIGTLFPIYGEQTTCRKPFEVRTVNLLGMSFTGEDLKGDSYSVLMKYWSFEPAKEPPAVWDGVGRPPVGTVCGLTYKGLDQGEVTVLFLSDEVGVFANSRYGVEQHGACDLYGFYQIRTPEQIADDERAKAAIGMSVDIGGITSAREQEILNALAFAGYRKQVAP